MVQRHFCAHFAPAASIAVWILQHKPELAGKSTLHVLVAQATDFEALDSGRWLQFIPWLLGRPGMKIRTTIVGKSLVQGAEGLEEEGAAAQDLDVQLRSHSWALVKDRPPSEIHLGTVASWLATSEHAQGPECAPDLCAVFSPTLAVNRDALLSADELLPLLQRRVPLALFSPTEAEQLLDAHTLGLLGLAPRERESWPNPWALSAAASDKAGAYARMGWAVELDSAPAAVPAGCTQLVALDEALEYVRDLLEVSGDDALLSLGEPIRATPTRGESADSASLLLRLPREVAVDSSNGYLYQLQDTTALLLDTVPRVPVQALDSFPGHEDLVARALWSVWMHREHVAPFAQLLDDALRSQFSVLDEKGASTAAA